MGDLQDQAQGLRHARPVPWSVRSAVAHQKAKAGEHEAAWQTLDPYFETAMLEAPAGCASTLFAASYVLDTALRSGEDAARWEVRRAELEDAWRTCSGAPAP